MNRLRFQIIAVATVASCLLVGCGKKGGEAPAAAAAPSGGPAAFPGMEADLQRTLKEQSSFYVFKTPADFEKDTRGLTWDDASDLPEFADVDAKKGGTLRLWIPDFPRTFRTMGPDATDSFRNYLLDETSLEFMHAHPNFPGRFYPELATSWAVDSAHKTVYIRLDPAARWSDGVPVTTDDVVFSWYFQRSPLLGDPWYNDFFTKTYSRLTVYGAHDFALTLPELKPNIVSLAGENSVYCRHFFRDFGPGWTERYNWRIAPTTGAYDIRSEDIKKEVSVTMTRLSDWWARDKRFLRGRFNPDRVRLVVVRDPAKALESFLRGDLDVIALTSPANWYDKVPNSHPEVAAGYIVKTKFFNDIPCPDMGLWINESKPPLDNRDVRLGIQYATNFDLICREYFRGDAVREQTASDGFGWRVNPNISARPFDPVKARAYFAQAGFTKQGPDGVLVNDRGQRLAFTVTTYFRYYQDLLTILKQEALKAGLEYNIEVLDETTAGKKMQEKQHDIVLMAFAVQVEMFPRYWETFAGENAYDVPYLADGSPNPARKVKPDTNNLTETAIPELDRLIHLYDHADSMAQVKDLAAKIEQIIYDDAGWVNGWKQPFYRLGYWRWVKWPAQFNARQSMDFEQYWLFSIDQEVQKETLAAKDAGKAFPPQILTFDQFKDK
jgi:microcin C transport system substrate-binding protein